MARTITLVVALAGAVGLGVGWLASAPRPAPAASRPHEVLKPPAVAVESGRHEFPLGAEDVAEDRETPAVAADTEGHVLVVWAAVAGENERTIYLARSIDGGKTFDLPVPFRKNVAIYRYTSRGKDKAMAYSTHVLPRLATAGRAFQIGWVEAIDGGPEVRYYVASSRDGGKTFSQPASVHTKDASRPGFTALSSSADGTLMASWLDGRNGGQQPYFAQSAPGSEGFEPEQLVYPGPAGKGICPCCDLAAVKLTDGSRLVAFRNTDAGHRDIWFARAPGGGPFGPPTALAVDNWNYSGCPHDGPSLVTQGDRVVAAWMSGHSGRNRVYAASATTADLVFTPHELSLGKAGAQGHPKLAAVGTGRLYAVWDQSLDADPAPAISSGHGKEHAHGHALTGDGRVVMLATTANDASGFGSAVAVSPRPGAFQLNPALTVGRDGALLIVWNEIDTAGKRVVFVRREPQQEGRP